MLVVLLKNTQMLHNAKTNALRSSASRKKPSKKKKQINKTDTRSIREKNAVTKPATDNRVEEHAA